MPTLGSWGAAAGTDKASLTCPPLTCCAAWLRSAARGLGPALGLLQAAASAIRGALWPMLLSPCVQVSHPGRAPVPEHPGTDWHYVLCPRQGYPPSRLPAPVRVSPHVTTGEGPGLNRLTSSSLERFTVKSCEAAF